MLVYLFRFLSRLPLRWLHQLGVVIGWLVYGVSPTYRQRLNQNLQRGGYLNMRERAVGEAGKGLLELAFVWCATPKRVLQTARIENWNVAQQALDSGKGVIFLTPHLGCFEIIAQVIASRMPLVALYRAPRKNMLKPLIEDARSRENLHLAPADLGGVRTLLKTLKRGAAIGLLPDQVPQNGEGVWAEFFDTPAYTMTLPAKLQQMTGAMVILSYAERLPKGRGFVIRFAPYTMLDDATPVQQATHLNQAMQTLIAHCPAQYFWSYNRFKTPAGVTPAMQ